MTDNTKCYRYAHPVARTVDERREREYEGAADFLNDSPVDIVSLQHEFGIYGGIEGRGLYRFLDRIMKPVVTTLHTVDPSPDQQVREMIRTLAERSARLVVMNPIARRILRRDYQISCENVCFIHHGAPAPSPEKRDAVKGRFGLQDRTVLCTFGFIHPRKGIEHVISALPKLLTRHPNLTYVVVGMSQNELPLQGADDYRESLLHLVDCLGLSDHVRIINRYLTKQEITIYLASADVYITPYLVPEQICSGTLAYAVAAGRAVISTPYLYARFLLSRGRGVLVDFAQPDSIAAAVGQLLQAPDLHARMEARARIYGRRMLWHRVGARYRDLFREAACVG